MGGEGLHALQPSSRVENEQFNTHANRPALVRALGIQAGDWFLYDNRVLESTLRILKAAALTIKLRVAEKFQAEALEGSGGMIGMSAIAKVFCSTSSLLLLELEEMEKSEGEIG